MINMYVCGSDYTRGVVVVWEWEFYGSVGRHRSKMTSPEKGPHNYHQAL